MTELWQLLDEQGAVLEGQGGTKDDVYTKGLLHGASHVWIWRLNDGSVEILLQKRSNDKRTWPNLYDISAAGHIDLGEDPIRAAIRETQEEIGIDISADDLREAFIDRRRLTAQNGAVENEFCWVYTLRLDNAADFTLQDKEVESLRWINVDVFKSEVFSENNVYVPHGDEYFKELLAALDKQV